MMIALVEEEKFKLTLNMTFSERQHNIFVHVMVGKTVVQRFDLTVTPIIGKGRYQLIVFLQEKIIL